jgi:large conductance mechanosensitive channel
MKKFFKEFGEFIQRGNIMDMAVGVVIGSAFAAIVTSLVNDIIMPLVSLATGGIDFTNLFVSLNGQTYKTLAEAQEAGASVLAYGSFIQAIVNFLIIALCIFITVNAMKKAKEKMEKRLKKEEKKEEEAKKSDEVVLLEQIRDLLKKQAK